MSQELLNAMNMLPDKLLMECEAARENGMILKPKRGIPSFVETLACAALIVVALGAIMLMPQFLRRNPSVGVDGTSTEQTTDFVSDSQMTGPNETSDVVTTVDTEPPSLTTDPNETTDEITEEEPSDEEPMPTYRPDGFLVEATVTDMVLGQGYFEAYCEYMGDDYYFSPILLRSYDELLALLQDMDNTVPDDKYHQQERDHSNVEEFKAVYNEAYFKEHDLILYPMYVDGGERIEIRGLYWNETEREYELHYVYYTYTGPSPAVSSFRYDPIETAKKLSPNYPLTIQRTVMYLDNFSEKPFPEPVFPEPEFSLEPPSDELLLRYIEESEAYQRRDSHYNPKYQHPFWIDRYYGRFGDVVFVYRGGGGLSYGQIHWTDSVAGYQYTYPDSNRIYVWAYGTFMTMEDAYEQGIITKEQVAVIYGEGKFIKLGAGKTFAALRRKIEADYAKSGENDTISRFYGIFDGCVPVMFNQPEQGAVSQEKVAGQTFNYNGGNTIKVWKDGNFYSLKEAYAQGLMRKECFEQLALEHRGGSYKQYDR